MFSSLVGDWQPSRPTGYSKFARGFCIVNKVQLRQPFHPITVSQEFVDGLRLGGKMWLTVTDSNGCQERLGEFEVRDLGNKSVVLVDKDGNTITLKVMGQGE